MVHILLVEDDPADAQLMRELLSASAPQFHIARHASSFADAERAVAEPGLELVLLDLTLPDAGGMAALEGLQARAQLPILVLGGPADEEIAGRMVQAGAQDYLVKGAFDGPGLHRAMRYAVERSRAERRLADESNLLHSLLQTVPDRIYFKDRASRFLRVNPAMARLFRLERCEDAIGKTDFDFFSPEHAEPAFADEQEIIRTGCSITGKVERETLPDGRVGWVLTAKVPLRDMSGHIIGTMGISHDITAMKRMEEELGHERNLLRSVIENILDPIFVKDAAGRYLLDNTAHLRALNKTREEVLGRKTSDFAPAEEAARVEAIDRQIIASRQPVIDHEEVWMDGSGARRILLTTKVPIEDPATHEVERLVCIRRDITQQKEAEEKLVRANAELSLAVTNLQTASEQLHAMQLQLIEAEKMKSIGRLAAGVAHEVKNPLAIVTMGVDYLEGQSAGADPSVREVLQEIRAAVQRADAVIRGLLDFSAPRRLELSPQDLAVVLDRVLLLVRGEMVGKRYEVKREFAPDLPPVPLDRTKIEQVFVNLITNAMHAMPDGGTLTLRLYTQQFTGMGENMGGEESEVLRAGDRVVVAEIDDTGAGLPEGRHAKIFDPFFTTKPTGKGTGLGLTVTRSIVDLHGGIIKIANRPEGGARATVIFRT